MLDDSNNKPFDSNKLSEKPYSSNNLLDDNFFKKFKPKFDLELNMQQLRGCTTELRLVNMNAFFREVYEDFAVTFIESE